MSLHPLAGIYAASITPTTGNGYALNPEPATAYLNFLAERGCHGALLFGTTGEGPSFSTNERKTLFKHAVAIRQKHPLFRLLAGTGTPSLEETIELNQAAYETGFEATVVLPPFYFRNASEAGLFQWFDTVIKRSVPEGKYLLGYHIPKVSGIPLSHDLIARLKDAHPKKFAGIKDSSHDLEHARSLGKHFGKDLLVLNGTDSYLFDALNADAQGCITAPANIISPQLRNLWDAYQQGNETKSIQEEITHIRELLENYMPFPPILKALISTLYGFPRWPVRPPLDEASPERIEEATNAIKATIKEFN
ncbi:MAG: dihydrodipicolinate synthase family protein [Anaerolineae bacterium]|nr:dihydrodipicolinate synthase family protein [Anaerolineae bacterium]MBT7069722.1 dihydrodipicolinate synthase family protein [Anaerolineae bacterium]MBT7326736.1 dihydrodipicolinate synthase family protein [Anaerolineae bacterium]